MSNAENAARDELAALIRRITTTRGGNDHRDYANRQADELLAAGYRKPRTIPDWQLLSDDDGDFPVPFGPGTLLQSADGSIWRMDDDPDFGFESLGWGSATLRGPATVLWEPGA